SSHRVIRPCASSWRSCREKYDVNDVVERIDANHDADRRDYARTGGGPNTGRAAFHGQAAVTCDRCDQQSEHEAFEHAGDDIANEQGVPNKIDTVRESDAEVSFAH